MSAMGVSYLTAETSVSLVVQTTLRGSALNGLSGLLCVKVPVEIVIPSGKVHHS